MGQAKKRGSREERVAAAVQLREQREAEAERLRLLKQKEEDDAYDRMTPEEKQRHDRRVFGRRSLGFAPFLLTGLAMASIGGGLMGHDIRARPRRASGRVVR